MDRLEEFLQSRILQDLERGRKGWDKEHTLAVVYYLKQILENIDSRLDRDVLTIAAYAHDWGYIDLFKDSATQFDDVMKRKKLHAVRGAEMLDHILKDSFFDFLTKEQKSRAVHLVKVHDLLNSVKDEDEITLVEADTLGGLDINLVKPTFDEESNEKYIRGVKKKRLSLFMHKFSKETAEKLLKEREALYLKSY